uniref:Uncharacterized protein n=1 Tax=Arcella intermedia TaxID=1963864 RepID=A0A6B2LMB1_9EUKA
MVIIGDTGVGKTSLLLRFVDNTFTDSSTFSHGEFRIKTLDQRDKSLIVKLQIWDPVGRFGRAPSYCAHGILVVYDVTEEESFVNSLKWLKEIDRNGYEYTIRMLVGNKCDLDDKRKVTTLDAQQLAEQLNIQFIETSAKNTTNIEEAFSKMTSAILNRLEDENSEYQDY